MRKSIEDYLIEAEKEIEKFETVLGKEHLKYLNRAIMARILKLENDLEQFRKNAS